MSYMINNHKLLVRAHTKSLATLLHTKIPQYIIGQNFEIFFEYENIGDSYSPRGSIKVIIDYPETRFNQEFTYFIPSMSPGQKNNSEIKILKALSSGLVNIILPNRDIEDGGQLILYREDKHTLLPKGESIHSFVCTTPEGVYTFWALIIAVISLFILIIEPLSGIFQVILKIITSIYNSIGFKIS